MMFRSSNRELYKYRNILEFVDDSYVLVNPISENNIKEMRNNMEENDLIAFDAFLERNWGIKPPKMVTDEEIEKVSVTPKVRRSAKKSTQEDE